MPKEREEGGGQTNDGYTTLMRIMEGYLMIEDMADDRNGRIPDDRRHGRR